jgi:MoaA/NifB/PqqE/SkfB family radical SAM enzyme
MLTQQSAKNPQNEAIRKKNLIEALKVKKITTIVIEPASKCNLRCTFCDAHSGRAEEFRKHAGLMSMEIFNLIVDKIEEYVKEFGQKVDMIQFHGNGEPLLHKNLAEMVSIIKKREITNSVRIISNGVLLKKNKIKDLVDAGIDEIHVSLDTIDKESYIRTKKRDQIDLVLKNVDDAIEIFENIKKPQFYIKYFRPMDHKDYMIKSDDAYEVIKKYRKNAENSKYVFLKEQILVDTGLGMLKGNKIEKPCEIPFFLIYILHTGKISACCSDVFNQLTIGEIKEQSLKEIMTGKVLRDIRLSHLDLNFEKFKLCHGCGNRTAVDLTNVEKEIRELI